MIIISFLSSKLKSIGNLGTVANVGMAAYFGLDTYQEKRREGASKASAAFSGALDAVLPMAMSIPGYLAFEAVTSTPSAIYEFSKWQAGYRRQLGRDQKQQAFQTAAFQDTQETYTMRQAGMAVAARGKYNAQQARLGREAQFLA